MAIPTMLMDVLQAQIASIDSGGNLPCIARKRVHQVIQDLSEKQHESAGYYRRVRIALQCTMRTHGFVETYSRLDSMFDELLEQVHLLSARTDLAALKRRNESFHALIDDLPGDNEGALRASYAAMCCYRMVDVVVHDMSLDDLAIDEKVLDPDRWDPAFYASLAESGSARWENKGGARERAAFWLWYLNEAIPLAWEIEKPLSSSAPFDRPSS